MSHTPFELMQKAFDELKEKNDRTVQLATLDGFFKAYFEECKKSSTNAEAFNKVNEQYCEIFGKRRYADFESFKSVVSYYSNKNKKKQK